MVKPLMYGQTCSHWAFMMSSMPVTNGATVPNATMSGAQSFLPASKSWLRTTVCHSVSQARSGAIGSVAIIFGRLRDWRGPARSCRSATSYEDRLGQERRHDPVGRVDDLADLEIDGHAAEHVRLLA